MQTALISLAAYLLGSISFAIVTSRMLRLPDPRSYGSKNPGATNVLRSGSRIAAALTLAGDAGKGWLAVWLAALYTGEAPAAGLDAALAGLCAFLGHLFPVFYNFRGGKGVATAAGVVLGIDPWLGLATLASFAAIVAIFRMVSLASILAALFAAFYAFWLFGLRAVTATVAIMALLLVLRHRDNIGRILRGEESKLGRKTA
ncbi:MAG TPA: glycerol-3-phosphate 1-O-acyltransferase PlsY [Burkholderiales bacterium]|jgi:glycerol-3-phosphate acyltransferase PlsY|nr:glycerol-3-phosphate 1-O-acyltransferase PlsY [Burkholderiales bacterium]